MNPDPHTHSSDHLEVSLMKALAGGQGPLQLSVTFSLPKHRVLAIMGPSGIGKTSILRMIAGLMKPDEGHISLGDRTWFDSPRGIHIAPQKRRVGFVFQDYGLFPNMTVLGNLRFANNRAERLIEEVLTLMELEDLADRKPDMLSGGQQQRVALARSIVQQPQLLLLDEPLAALDAPTRLRLQQDLRTIHTRFAFTTVLVSHDRAEVVQLADEVLVLNEFGTIAQQGDPADMFSERPQEKLTGEVIRVSADGRIMYVRTGTEIWQIPYRKPFKEGSTIDLRPFL